MKNNEVSLLKGVSLAVAMMLEEEIGPLEIIDTCIIPPPSWILLGRWGMPVALWLALQKYELSI